MPETAIRDERTDDHWFDSFIDAAIAVASELELDQLLERVVGVARELVGARYVALSVWEDGAIVRFVQSGLDAHEAALIGDPPHGGGILGVIVREGRPIRVDDLAADPRAGGVPAFHPRVQSFLGVPVKVRGHVYGDLYLANKLDAVEFSDEDESLAVGLAGLAGVAIENATLFGRERQTVERLQELDQLRSDFVSIVSHELRNPLATMRNLAMVLRDREPSLSDAERRSYADEIVLATDRLALLVEHVLTESRIEAGVLSYVMAPYDLTRLVRGSVEEARTAHSLHVFEASGLDRVRMVNGDHERMRQVFANLLANAARYSPSGSTVAVSCWADDDDAFVSVRDEGIGIAAPDMQRLFQRFVRLGNARSFDTKGTGLGLYISKSIVEAHGGDIRVDSELRRGSVFTVRVPIATPPPPRPRPRCS